MVEACSGKARMQAAGVHGSTVTYCEASMKINHFARPALLQEPPPAQKLR